MRKSALMQYVKQNKCEAVIDASVMDIETVLFFFQQGWFMDWIDNVPFMFIVNKPEQLHEKDSSPSGYTKSRCGGTMKEGQEDVQIKRVIQTM